MAMITIPGGFYFPRRPNHLGASIAYDAVTLSEAGDKAAFVIQAPKTGSIRKIGWLTGTVTTGATMDVRAETVSATNGEPTGTLFGTNTNGSQVVADANDNTWFTTTLTADASVTKGDILAVVIVNPGTPGNMQIRRISNAAILSSFPYSLNFQTGIWSKLTGPPVVALEYSDGTYARVEGAYPFSEVAELIVDTGTTPDEVGLKITMPWTARVTGFWTWHKSGLSASPFDVKLYDTDGSSVLATRNVDQDIDQATLSQVGIRQYMFASTYTLNSGGSYRLTVLPSDTNDLIMMAVTSPNTTNFMNSFDGGTNVKRTERTDAGSWTDTDNKLILMGLLIDGIDVTLPTPNVIRYIKKVR